MQGLRCRGSWARQVPVVAAVVVAMGHAYGQSMGLFTFPHVDAHGRGIPGVTRPMLMAGPGMLGMGGGMAGPMVNPNWTCAAAMFAPELLMRGGMMPGMMPGMGATLPAPAVGVGAPATGRWGMAVPGGPTHEPVASARITPGVRPQVPRVAAASMPPPQVERSADERLLAFQQAEARKGSPGAQRALAVRYEKGDGVERSDELARAWRAAAERSEAAAALP